jgi:hypothetical protein
MSVAMQLGATDVQDVAAPVPDLFAAVPAAFFAPLTGRYAALYWATLARYYQYEFEEPTNGLVKPVAIELAEDVVRRSSLWRDEPDVVLREMAADEPYEALTDEAAQLRATARRIVDRLERSGWFHFEYRSQLGELLNFYPYAARILNELLRVARDEQPVLPGYALTVLNALRPESVASRPGWAVAEVRRVTAEFVRELKVLNRNIYDATRRLLAEATSASAVLEDLLGRYQRRVMGSFHRLKTVDNPFRHRGEIFARLDALEDDAQLLESAARWHAEQHDVDLASARTAVAEALRTARWQFETLPDLIDDIDARNARFSGIARNKLVYLLSRNRHVDGQLQRLIDRLTSGEAPPIPFDVYRCQLLGDDFLYTPPERRAPSVPLPLAEAIALNPPHLRDRAERLLRQPFGERAIREYVERFLAGRRRADAAEIPIATDDDYVRYICVLAYGLGHGAPYHFTPTVCARPGCAVVGCPDCHRTAGPYRVPTGTIERRAKTRSA